MRVQWKPEQLWKLLDKYKYVLLILAAGVLLLLWPAGEKAQPAPDASQGAAEAFDLAALEEKISRTLSQVEGVEAVEITAGGRRVSYRSHQLLSAQEAVLWDELADDAS